MYGIKTKADGDYCVACSAKIIDVYNFCPKCGNPLTKNANNLNEQRLRAVKIELLDELASSLNDENSLKTILEKLKNI